MKIDWQSISNLADKKSWYQISSRLRVLVHQAPRILFIRHSHIIDIIAVGMGLLLASYLVFLLVFKPPTDINMNNAQKWDLQIDTLKDLSNWVIERQKEKERVLEFNRSEIFKMPIN